MRFTLIEEPQSPAPRDLPGTTDAIGLSVSARVVRGALWVMALRVLGRVATLSRTIVLVRLLTPHDFGLVGVALTVIACAEALASTGVNLALLGRRELDRAAYDTAWTIGIVRGVAMSTLLVVLAPYLAAFFHAPEATNIIRLMALAPSIEAFNNIGVIEFRREMTFGPYYVLQAAGEFADLIVAVALAWWTGSPWALAWSWIALWTVRVVVSYVIHPYRPRLRVDLAQSRELLRFAWHVAGTGGVAWLLGGGIDALVGRVLGIETLAFYRMAKVIALVVPAEIAGIVSWVSVGAFARLAGAHGRVRDAFVELLRVTLVATVPICIGTAVYADTIVLLVFGPSWMATVPVVRVMALVGLGRVVMAVTASAFQGLGVPKYQMYTSLIELGAVFGPFMPLAGTFGLTGAAFAVAAGAGIALITAAPMLQRVAGVHPLDIARCLAWPLIAVLPLLALHAAVGGATTTLPRFLGVIVASALAYVACLVLVERAGWAPPTVEPVLRQWSRRHA